jgi:NTE family protein
VNVRPRACALACSPWNRSVAAGIGYHGYFASAGAAMNFRDQPTNTAGAPAAARGKKAINLALQGGGSHGAFTWGVLDRLLEEERLTFEGITATSSGAVNAVVLVDGLAADGRQGARAALRRYWQKLSEFAARSLFTPSAFDRASPDFGLEHSPGFLFVEPATYFASPYQMNPLNFNPLRDMLAELIDFERVRRQTAVKLFVCATNLQTSKIKVFNGEDLDVARLLASTCLPLMMQAIEVDGEYFWDGSYAGNPAIFPLVYNCQCRDIVLVHITPSDRRGVPTTSPAIMNRMQEISFNTALIREMRTIAYLNRLVDDGRVDGGKPVLVHVIEGQDLIAPFSWTSRLNGDWKFLSHLHELGRARADEWLSAHFDAIGVGSTVNLEERYF